MKQKTLLIGAIVFILIATSMPATNESGSNGTTNTTTLDYTLDTMTNEQGTPEKTPKEKKEFIIKYKNEFDKSKLNRFTQVKALSNKITKFKSKIKDITDIITDNNVEIIEIDQETEVLSDAI